MRSSLPLASLLVLALAACGSGSPGDGPSTSSTGGGGAGAAAHTEPLAQFIPAATGPCPDFSEGKLSFSPDGVARPVEIWIDPAAAQAQDGPLVFFWHGAGGDPSEATYALGPAVDAIKAMGGIIAAPYHDPAASLLPWYLSTGGANEGDLRVADEVLACAIAKVGVDKRRIHSVGFSAGAMNTEQFVTRRSGYLASIVAYSGALMGYVEEQDPQNLYAAMLLYGGANDQVIVNFATETKKYHDALVAAGHFAFVCDHEKGHTVPGDARASAWQFLQDHPFGVKPEPYAGGLPAGFPSYCGL